jgi:putative nucleotidyltransferase with HDIG domain
LIRLTLWNHDGTAAPVPDILFEPWHAAQADRADSTVRAAGVYVSILEALALEVDRATLEHARRVQKNAITLAREVGIADGELLEAIAAAGLLHDIGKAAVPDHLLKKPGPLDTDEFEQVKQHAARGAEMLQAVRSPFPLVSIVRHHHENWDGTGYPDALRGAAIPIGARILSVIDCYDALTSHRPYRPALSRARALAMVTERRGTMYDPAVVAAFLRVQPDLPCAPDSADLDHAGEAPTR